MGKFTRNQKKETLSNYHREPATLGCKRQGFWIRIFRTNWTLSETKRGLRPNLLQQHNVWNHAETSQALWLTFTQNIRETRQEFESQCQVCVWGGDSWFEVFRKLLAFSRRRSLGVSTYRRVQKTKNIRRMAAWASCNREIRVERADWVTQMTTLYGRGEQESISGPAGGWATTADAASGSTPITAKNLWLQRAHHHWTGDRLPEPLNILECFQVSTCWESLRDLCSTLLKHVLQIIKYN